MSRHSPSASTGTIGSIERSSSRVPVQATAASAPLQRSSRESIITSAEQHKPNASSTMDSQSGDLSDLQPIEPLIPTPQSLRRSDPRATNITPTPFQSDPGRSEASTVDGWDSPMPTSSLVLLNSPSDIHPIVTETVPPTISSKALTIPPVLTGVDDLLSEIDTITVSPLDWVTGPQPDNSLETTWDALPVMGTHPLDFAPTTAATLLAENLQTPETSIIVSIPAGWTLANPEIGLNQEEPLKAQGSDESLRTSYIKTNIIAPFSTAWSSANQEISLGQEAGSAAHMKPLQTQVSESLSSPYTHRLPYQQPAMAAPTEAVDVPSRSWQKASVTRTPTKSLTTPLITDLDQMIYHGGSLTAMRKEETDLTPTSTPPPLDQGDGGRLVLPPTSTSSSQLRNLAKPEEIYDSGPRTEDETTSTSINTVPANPEIATGTSAASDGPDWRPSTTTTSGTTTRSVDTDSVFDQVQRAQPISRHSVAVSAGAASAGMAVFILTFVLHRCVYRWVGRRRTGVIWIGHGSNVNTGSHTELLSRRSRNPEVSYFSDGS